MLKKMTTVLGTALLFAGSASAQLPDEMPRVVPAPALPAAPVVSAGEIPGELTPGQRFWISADVVTGWFGGGTPLPPLVTSSSANTPITAAGVLGQPTTAIGFGGNVVNDDMRVGFRLGAGWWFDPHQADGIEAGFMFLGGEDFRFATVSNGSIPLAQPFFNVTTGQQAASIVAFPGNSAGIVNIRDTDGNLYEFHLDFVENVVDSSWVRLDCLLGYRFYSYGDSFTNTSAKFPSGAAFVPGTFVIDNDQFDTRNTFNGGDFGLRTKFVSGDFTLALLTKCAVGNVTRELDISGFQINSVPGAAPVAQFGGLYALSSNIGAHESSQWTVMPEFGVNLSWQATANMRVSLGYSALMLEDVLRAADQIDFNINPALLPPATAATGTIAPTVHFNTRDIWVQTLNFGVDFSF